MKKFFKISSIILGSFLLGAIVRMTFAGSLTPVSPPASTMYTLDGIYNKLVNNTTSQIEGSQSFTTPASTSSTFYTLKQIYESIPTLDATKIKTGTTYMGVAGTLLVGLPKTEQTGCFDVSGTPVSCIGTGQDGEYQKGRPASGSRFVDNSNGTIFDNATELMWKKCTEGQSGSDCSGGSPSSSSWTTALSTCEADTTAGYTDWRLPNMYELSSIISMTTANPTINTTFFPNTPAYYFWSSTTYQGNGNENAARNIDFGIGITSASSKVANLHYRCVR